MVDGDINGALGELRGTVTALANQIGSLVQQWGQQDRAASAGRREMYQKMNSMSLEFALLKMTVEHMRPLVDAGHAAALRASGVRYILKALWIALVALVGALGATVVNWLARPMPPHH